MRKFLLILALAGVWPAVLPAQEQGTPGPGNPETLTAANAVEVIAQETAAIQAHPQDANAYILRGKAYMKGGHYDKAIADFDQATKIDPWSKPAYFQRARSYKFEGHFDEAIVNFSKVIQYDPKNVPAYVSRGQVYNLMRNYDLAIADFDQAIKLNPSTYLAYYSRAKSHQAKKDFSQASTDLQAAIKSYLDFAPAYNDLAWLLATCPQADVRDGKKAVDYAMKACTLSQWSRPNQIDTLAASYAESGDFDNAVKWESKFLEYPGIGSDRISKAQARLALYQARLPYHRGDNLQSDDDAP